MTPASGRDLDEAEFEQLDELLARTPEPFEPLDSVMLDGFLCGVIVQPMLLQHATWLQHVFDFEGRPLPDDVDAGWRAETESLIARRHAALNRALAEDGWFDPLILEPDDEADDEIDPEDPAAAVPAISRALMPWVAGFQHAMACFPDLEELDDEGVALALARLYRHLPAGSEEERELVETLDQEQPLETLDEAIDDLVASVADLYELTAEARYHVDTVRRETPKVGRNDPCPCGSGRKYKQCHGGG